MACIPTYHVVFCGANSWTYISSRQSALRGEKPNQIVWSSSAMKLKGLTTLGLPFAIACIISVLSQSYLNGKTKAKNNPIPLLWNYPWKFWIGIGYFVWGYSHSIILEWLDIKLDEQTKIKMLQICTSSDWKDVAFSFVWESMYAETYDPLASTCRGANEGRGTGTPMLHTPPYRHGSSGAFPCFDT